MSKIRILINISDGVISTVGVPEGTKIDIIVRDYDLPLYDANDEDNILIDKHGYEFIKYDIDTYIHEPEDFTVLNMDKKYVDV